MIAGSSPLFCIHFPYPPDHISVPFSSGMAHVQASYIHPILSQLLQHFCRLSSRPNGANDSSATSTPGTWHHPILNYRAKNMCIASRTILTTPTMRVLTEIVSHTHTSKHFFKISFKNTTHIMLPDATIKYSTIQSSTTNPSPYKSILHSSPFSFSSFCSTASSSRSQGDLSAPSSTALVFSTERPSSKPAIPSELKTS